MCHLDRHAFLRHGLLAKLCRPGQEEEVGRVGVWGLNQTHFLLGEANLFSWWKIHWLHPCLFVANTLGVSSWNAYHLHHHHPFTELALMFLSLIVRITWFNYLFSGCSKGAGNLLVLFISVSPAPRIEG